MTTLIKIKKMRTYSVLTGKKVKGFKKYSVDVPNLSNGTIEKVLFFQVPYLCIAFFMGYKLAQ